MKPKLIMLLSAMTSFSAYYLHFWWISTDCHSEKWIPVLKCWRTSLRMSRRSYRDTLKMHEVKGILLNCLNHVFWNCESLLNNISLLVGASLCNYLAHLRVTYPLSNRVCKTVFKNTPLMPSFPTHFIRKGKFILLLLLNSGIRYVKRHSAMYFLFLKSFKRQCCLEPHMEAH